MLDGPRPLVPPADRRRRADCPAEPMDSRAPALHPLHLRHDGQAEGHRAHHGRIPRRARTRRRAGSSICASDDVYWCTADIGWVTGHSYVVYGPLMNGATVLMYEGAPDWPGEGPLLGSHRAPRRHDPLHGARQRSAHSCAGATDWPARHDLSSLRLLGIGRRANQSRGMDVVLRGTSATTAAPMVDTWWQTETGAIMITPLPGDHADEARARATVPFPGVAADDARRRGRARSPKGAACSC